MKMLWRVFFVLCLTSTVCYANEESIVLQWLQKTRQAMNTLGYQGTVAFYKNGHLDTMKFYHAVENGRRQERLLSLNSPMREVVREAGKVRCLYKKTNELVVNHRPVNDSFIVDLPDDFSFLHDVYRFHILTEQAVAMRNAHVVSIVPKDQYRYQRKFWIDQENFLPLKTEVYDLTGDMVEQVVFTEIKLDNQPRLIDISAAVADPKAKHLHNTDLLPVQQASFELRNLPVNFRVVFLARMNEKSAEHMLLTDGFSSVSIYREAKAEDAEEGLHILGSVKSYTQFIGEDQITVMGEVPARTVQFIAAGVQLK